MYVIKSPLSVWASGKRKFILNLNFYRNAHYFTLNKAKVIYKEQVQAEIDELPSFAGVSLELVLYPQTKRLCDVANVCAIHDKFFCDALVESGKLPDDDYRYISNIVYRFGEVDKDNPRVDIHIRGEIQ